MKCPACRSLIDDESYRCKECQRICSYWRLTWRYRYVIGMVALAVFALWFRAFTARLLAPSYERLSAGALVSDITTRQWLGLRDDAWFCEAPHHKGDLLHLRHKVFQTKDVIVFIHGFVGDYVTTWGTPRTILDDPRFNRNYDFVFYGFKTALYGDVPAFDEEARRLDTELTRLEENYKTITLVTHSKGGLLAMRALLNRAEEFPKKLPYKLHRIVMFTPLTENVSLNSHPGLVELLAKESVDLRQMEATTYCELGKVKSDLKALLESTDLGGEAKKQRFLKDVVDRLYVINAEKDGVVDVGPHGEKIVNESLRKLSEQPTLGPARVVTLRYNEIGGPEEEASVTNLRALPNPAYSHTMVVKMGEQKNFSFFNKFEELLFDRIGTPPRQAAMDSDQIRQNVRDRLDDSVFAMNRFVVEKEPMVGLCWRNIADAVEQKCSGLPEPMLKQKKEEFTKQVYYIYIFLDMYARMDDLRSRGLLSANDEKIKGGRQSYRDLTRF